MLEIVAVSRNRSIYVKTLHTLLAIEGICSHVNIPISFTFCPDEMRNKVDILKNVLKTGNRIIWLEYGVSCDRNIVHQFVARYDAFDGVIFPVVKDGIDWKMFADKVKSGSKEPSNQAALSFDTVVDDSKCVDEANCYYKVKSTTPQLWSIDSKSVVRKIKDKKVGLVIPDTIDGFFDKCLKKNVKLFASASARTFNHFTHECVGNIMNVSNVKVDA